MSKTYEYKLETFIKTELNEGSDCDNLFISCIIDKIGIGIRINVGIRKGYLEEMEKSGVVKEDSILKISQTTLHELMESAFKNISNEDQSFKTEHLSNVQRYYLGNAIDDLIKRMNGSSLDDLIRTILENKNDDKFPAFEEVVKIVDETLEKGIKYEELEKKYDELLLQTMNVKG